MKEECAKCGSTDWLYLHGRCHISSPTWCRKKGNVIEILCATCNKLIVRYIIEENNAVH